MNLAGTLKMGADSYYVYMHDVKNSVTTLILSATHLDDTISTDTPKYPVIQNPMDLGLLSKKDFVEGYLLGGTIRLKTSNRVKVYGNQNLITRVNDKIYQAKSYKFTKAEIQSEKNYAFMQSIIDEFHGVSPTLDFSYTYENNLLKAMHIVYSDFELTLNKVPFSLPIDKNSFTEISGVVKKKILLSDMKDISFQDLADISDLSWYVEDGIYKKDYRVIENIRDFELQVITPIVKKVLECQEKGIKLDITLDTETTGLNVYNLAKDNEDKHHVVAIPMSWDEDQGVTIFTDMEYFGNVDIDYVVKRLNPLLSKSKEAIEYTIFEECEQAVEKTNTASNIDLKLLDFDLLGDTIATANIDTTTVTTASDSSAVNNNSSTLQGLKERKVIFYRSSINLTGHNAMFDIQGMYDAGCDIYFDDDTMQMAFNIDPRVSKGSKALKVLTRKIFNHETPELSTLLGKGNEDKYRYLSDKEIAKIYGCADADYTRKVLIFLRNLMEPTMYQFYRKLDMPVLNQLGVAGYNGVMTVHDNVMRLAENSKKNIEILQKFLYSYLGAYIDYTSKCHVLEKQLESGLISKEKYDALKSNIKPDETKVYVFDFTPAEIRNVLYYILKYPIKAWTDGGKSGVKMPKTDKYVLKKLLSEKRNPNDTHFTKMKQDLIAAGVSREEYEQMKHSKDKKLNKKAESLCLINAEEFNSKKYPVALVFQKYAEINKDYTAYYNPIVEQNLESKIFKPFSMTRIETRRIANAIQTMKGDLKANIRSYSDDYYMIDFDMSQIEYRIMLSLSHHQALIEKMNNPENDYHTETASLINGIPPHKVSKKVRKSAKTVSFGEPYGLGEISLCSQLFGEVTDETLLETRIIISKWEANNSPIVDLLNTARDEALVETEISDELRTFMDLWEKDEDGNYLYNSDGSKVKHPVSLLRNAYGFYRVFDLKDVSQTPSAIARRATGKFTKEEAAIRRPAGNYKIQSLAAEIFRIILIRFAEACEKYGVADKVMWHMLIHDELLLSCHKSVHPFLMYKIIKEACMITFKGHTKYFVGINIGNTWAETKDDAREAPVYFVDRMIKKWDSGYFGEGPFWFDDPWDELIKGEREKYVSERIYEVVKMVQPDIDSKPINVPHLLQNMSNYTVRAYVNDYSMNVSINKEDFDKDDVGSMNEYDDRVWASKLETWAIERFGEGKLIIDYDGLLKPLGKNSNAIAHEIEIVDNSELFEDEIYADNTYWSFDEQEFDTIYHNEYDFRDDDEDEKELFKFDMSVKGAKNITDYIVRTSEYQNLKDLGEQIIITLSSPSLVTEVKNYLKKQITTSGKTVLFKVSGQIERWISIKNKTNLKELDTYIESLEDNAKLMQVTSSDFKKLKVYGQQIMVPRSSDMLITKCKQVIDNYTASNGFKIVFQDIFGNLENYGYVNNIDVLKEIDNIISS